MKVTITSNGVIQIDNVAYVGFDMSTLDPSIHAIQWWNDFGEIEIKDINAPENKVVLISNVKITDISPYQYFIDMWNIKDEKEKQANNVLL